MLVKYLEFFVTLVTLYHYNLLVLIMKGTQQ